MCAPDIQTIYEETARWKAPINRKESQANEKRLIHEKIPLEKQPSARSIVVKGTPPPPADSSLALRFKIQRQQPDPA